MDLEEEMTGLASVLSYGWLWCGWTALSQELWVPICNPSTPINTYHVFVITHIFHHMPSLIAPFGYIFHSSVILNQNILANLKRFQLLYEHQLSLLTLK